MLSLALIEEVKRLLDEGRLSQRAIAEKLAVSRGTVSALATGKRHVFGREQQAGEDPSTLPLAPPERCPGCGGMVHMPCVLCEALAYLGRHEPLERAA
ncbi:hypothetical protein Mal64_38050 [Pseudobythopirellula maris]|uniref:HTH cro/C1-type domain-containing protein n=1 Tax=Pseudobythopirellula maris TaxID=2527991 RepID=A0A5C5ZGM9_9BACT|nr:winged helix-turn-helix transcriptional regulator [Pseudobythopirellula maris]TWT86265.1 hypothetical protein Mal64_38050 [Pseudobythopirellula maris]